MKQLIIVVTLVVTLALASSAFAETDFIIDLGDGYYADTKGNMTIVI